MSTLKIPSSDPFTRSQAHDLGWKHHQLADQVANGGLVRLLHGAYLSSSSTDSMDNRAAALRLVAPGDVVFCDRTAAWLHGVDVYDYRELELLPPVDCCLTRDGNRVERPECRGVQRDLSPDEICVVGGSRVTTPLRTALDLGAMLSRPNGLAALDAFMRLHGLTREMFEARLPRYRGRRGVVKLRGLVALATPLAESPGESWTRLAILDDDIPAPQPQHWVTHGGAALFRLDLAWPKSRVAVEYDGEEWHDRTPAQRTSDRKRRTWLADHGWTVIVVTKDQLTALPREAWLRELRLALGLGW